MKRVLSSIFILIVVLFQIGIGYGTKQKNKSTPLAKTAVKGDYVHVSPNQISTFIRNNGSFNRDPGTGSAGFKWPAGSSNTAIYASGLWLGGKYLDTIRVAIAEYSYEYDAGPVGSNSQDGQYRVFVIYRGDDENNSTDYANWPFDDGAPAVRTFNNLADSLDARGRRIPLLIGDMTLWCVYNDANIAVHTNMNTPPIGVEVQLTAWAFNRSDALGNTIFYKWRIINKSGQKIDSMYTAVWSDCDIGLGNYDFDGCDSTLGLGYTYSAIANNALYALQPPAAGFDFLQGPIVTSSGDTARLPDGRILPDKKILMMTSYLKYDNDASDLGNPATGAEVYNYFKGLTRTGQQILDANSNPVKFMYSGDPTAPYNATTNWIEQGGGGDRRFLMTAGPFDMFPNDTQDVVAGNLIAAGSDNLTATQALKDADILVQLAYDLNFKLAPPPPAPRVEVASIDNGIVLSWAKDEANADLIENFWNVDPIAAKKKVDSIFNFEGYVVYQFANVSGANPRIIGIYDKVNNIKAILDSVFDSSIGSYVWRNVKVGNDNGLIRYLRLTKDVYTGQPFINNKDYYFAVTAYSYNPGSIPKTNESAISIITVKPRQQLMGSAFSSIGTDTIGTYNANYRKKVITASSGASNGYILPIILNPDSVTGDTYEVRFDSTGGIMQWQLRNMTKNLISTSGRTNMDGESLNYPVIDGILWKVVDAPSAIDYVRVTPSASSDRWVTGWSGVYEMGYLPTGDGGVDLASFMSDATSAWHSTYPFALHKTVEIRIDTNNQSWTYRYRRFANANGPHGARMVFQEMVKLPFQAWDITDTANPRQLNLAWRDQVVDGMFNPWPDDGSGAYEVMCVANSSYDSTGTYYNTPLIEGGPFETDGMYVLDLAVRSGHTAFERPNTITIKPFFINTVNDVYTVETAPYKSTPGKVDVAKAQLDRIHIVPNPYFGASAYERNQYTKVVRLTNLPARATVRIYSLLGELVRVLEKNNSTETTIDWDLNNENQLPIASGLYIIHIDMGDIGTKILKFAVIQSAERLDNF